MKRGFVLPAVLLVIAFLSLISARLFFTGESTQALISESSKTITAQEAVKNAFLYGVDLFAPANIGIECAEKTPSLCLLSFFKSVVSFNRYFTHSEHCTSFRPSTTSLAPRATHDCVQQIETERFETRKNLVLDHQIVTMPSILLVHGVLKIKELQAKADLTLVVGSYIEVDRLDVDSMAQVTVISGRSITLKSITAEGFLRTVDRDGERTAGIPVRPLGEVFLTDRALWGITW